MKRILILMLIVVFIATVGLAGISCKTETTKEITEEATEETSEETSEEVNVVAEDQLLFIYSSGFWSHPNWQQAKHGALSAEKFLEGKIKMEFAGPEGLDTDAMLTALESSIAKDPAGIMWLPYNIGEGPALTEYHDNGGLVCTWVGVEESDHPIDITVGIDNTAYGRTQIEWVIEEMEKRGQPEFKIGIMTIHDHPIHRARDMAVTEYIKDMPGIEWVGPYIEETTTPEGAAENAAAYIAVNPDVDVYISNAAMGAAALARAIEEAGYAPGEKLIIGDSQDAELVKYMKNGYILGSVGNSYAVEIFYGILAMAAAKLDAVPFTEMDEESGFGSLPRRIVTPIYKYTADNIDALETIVMP